VKGQTGLQDVDEVLGVARVLGPDLTFQEILIPEVVTGEFLGTVDGDGIGVVDQIAAEGLGANQAAYQVDVRLFEVGHVDVAQQPEQGVGVRQGLQFGKQQAQVGLELRARQLAVDLASGGELKDEHQPPVEQQHGEPMPTLLGVAGLGNLSQGGEQRGQFPAQDAQLSADRRLAGLLFRGDGGIGRAAVG